MEGVHGGGRRWRRPDPEVEGEDGKRWRRRRTEPENILNILTNMQLEEVRSAVDNAQWWHRLKVDTKSKMLENTFFSRWRRWQRRAEVGK